MAQDANRRVEVLEAAIREQATVGRASAEAQVKALESNVVDIKGVGKPETLDPTRMPERFGKPGVTSSRAGSAPSFLYEGKSAWTGQGAKVMSRFWTRPSQPMPTPALRLWVWTVSYMWRLSL